MHFLTFVLIAVCSAAAHISDPVSGTLFRRGGCIGKDCLKGVNGSKPKEQAGSHGLPAKSSMMNVPTTSAPLVGRKKSPRSKPPGKEERAERTGSQSPRRSIEREISISSQPQQQQQQWPGLRADLAARRSSSESSLPASISSSTRSHFRRLEVEMKQLRRQPPEMPSPEDTRAGVISLATIKSLESLKSTGSRRVEHGGGGGGGSTAVANNRASNIEASVMMGTGTEQMPMSPWG